MARNEKDILIDNITFLVLSILTVPMALYFGVVAIFAVIPALRAIWALIACVGILLGTLFGLFIELGPIMIIFAVPIALMFFQEYGGGNRR